MRHTSRTSGFTLIELSIALVIIGLLVGGVLVGRDLIKAAQIRSTISQLEEYQMAVTTFKLKYACVPGDCPNATQYGLGDNGDGNGFVFQNLAQRSESLNFWAHLSAAGLAKFTPMGESWFDGYRFDPLSHPQAKLEGIYIIPVSPLGYSNNLLILQKEAKSNYEDMTKSGIDSYIAKAIDDKIDDGKPNLNQRALGLPSRKVMVEGALRTNSVSNTEFILWASNFSNYWMHGDSCTLYSVDGGWENSAYRSGQRSDEVYYYGYATTCFINYRLD
jgi:prepilin-type N-terminal cleavage/methylation domain-containing protein